MSFGVPCISPSTARDFLAREDHRHPVAALDMPQSRRLGQGLCQDVAVKDDHGVQRLGLWVEAATRRAKARWIRRASTSGAPRVAGCRLPLKDDELADPVAVAQRSDIARSRKDDRAEIPDRTIRIRVGDDARVCLSIRGYQ